MTILYVNGDSHSAGAEIANACCFAKDDAKYWALGRAPHPDNLRLSYGQHIANCLNTTLVCAAESASSNTRIIRTTKEYLKNNRPDLIIIGWSTWEREEWLHEGVYYQVTASGTDSVPQELKEQYKNWVVAKSAKKYNEELAAHKQIWDFHNELTDQGIKHLFFNTYLYFRNIVVYDEPRFDWGTSFIDPYTENQTYYYWLKNLGFKTVNPNSYHFGAPAHQKWAEYLLVHLTTNE